MSERLDAITPAREILDQFTSGLAQVLESMAEQRPVINWRAASGTVAEVTEDPQDEILWWEQPLQFAPEMKIWVGAPHSAWEQAGTLTLQAAGLETVETSEAKNTWFEILGQALSTVSGAIGGILGREVTCETGKEHAPDAGVSEWASISLSFKESPLAPLLVAFSPALLPALLAPPPVEEEPANAVVPAETAAAEPELLPARARTMKLLMDVDLPVSISFGKTQLPMKDVIKLTSGSIVELNRSINEPVDILVNQCLIARGEVVVVDGNYGVRILEIATRNERLRTIR